ncbi:DUF805 domain-containing protein [Hyphomonas sp. FCG-A18]|uniref:DUF805 domain-containing protein n=1 Tax=Hyphomonas sp. FCG-A18 TaxID=3080019 RepID=UPI002B322966|nr:DUF805 domain-containing protein [Hyphomonas sp. FCG-A18]
MDFNPNFAIEITKKNILERYWDPDGRETRKPFWHFFAVIFAVNIIVSVIGSILGIIPLIGGLLSLLLSLATLVLIPPTLSAGIRRVHDNGLPWWHAIIPLWNLWQFAQPGQTESNDYGPAPTPAGT